MSDDMPPGAPDPGADTDAWGLCAGCLHRRVVTSDRGTRFVLCARALVDPAYRKYPTVPVIRCPGLEPAG